MDHHKGEWEDQKYRSSMLWRPLAWVVQELSQDRVGGRGVSVVSGSHRLRRATGKALSTVLRPGTTEAGKPTGLATPTPTSCA